MQARLYCIGKLPVTDDKENQKYNLNNIPKELVVQGYCDSKNIDY